MTKARRQETGGFVQEAASRFVGLVPGRFWRVTRKKCGHTLRKKVAHHLRLSSSFGFLSALGLASCLSLTGTWNCAKGGCFSLLTRRDMGAQGSSEISTWVASLAAGGGRVRSPVVLPERESQPALQNFLVPRQAQQAWKVAQLGVRGTKPEAPGEGCCRLTTVSHQEAGVARCLPRVGATPKARVRLMRSRNTLLKALLILEIGPSAGFPPRESGWSTSHTSVPTSFIWGSQALATRSCLPPPSTLHFSSDTRWTGSEHRRRGAPTLSFIHSSSRSPSWAWSCSWHQGTTGSTANRGAGSAGLGRICLLFTALRHREQLPLAVQRGQNGGGFLVL
uniref:Uncharacterized protein LOC123617344 n=1 Tax=Camelus bactrianus TaxID=9837 RepID=A0A9W3G7X1_CAMBA|nr:uncharacterized protein LOC123617344 [Camelus bactrianus]